MARPGPKTGGLVPHPSSPTHNYSDPSIFFLFYPFFSLRCKPSTESARPSRASASACIARRRTLFIPFFFSFGNFQGPNRHSAPKSRKKKKRAARSLPCFFVILPISTSKLGDKYKLPLLIVFPPIAPIQYTNATVQLFFCLVVCGSPFQHCMHCLCAAS